MTHFMILLASSLMALAPSAAVFNSASLSAAAKEFLDTHNKARAAVGVAPLIWSQSLATATNQLAVYQKTRKQCELANVNPIKYGMNQLWAEGKVVTPRFVVEEWVKVKQFYDYGANKCKQNNTCGIYKQVVWRNSKELGCSMVGCLKKRTVNLFICFYNPPGNIVGQKPY